ncbi:MAG: extracellular solute-binding protein [Lachnospiraceae bacterium]|nr:extracellular solute-binding protein [Lachnospiraceae bacterium]
MKKMFRVFALLLAVLVTVTACGQSQPGVPSSGGNEVQSSEAGETDKTSEKVQLRFATITRGSVPMDDIYMTQYLEEKFNVDIIWEEYANDAWKNQFSLMLTTDNLPDMILGANLDKNAVNDYGADGYFLNIMDYIDYMPNLKGWLNDETYANWAKYQMTDDGAIYGLQRVFPSRIGVATEMNTWINNEWLENVNMEVPQTLDELYEVLKAFKEQDANGNGDPTDEIPLCMQIDVNGARGWRTQPILLSAYGFVTNKQNLISYVDETGTVGVAETTEEYKEYLKFMNKLYKEGLMEPNAFIITNEERVDKTINDKYGVFSDYSGLVTATGGTVEGNPFEKYSLIGALTSEYNGELVHPFGNCGYSSGSRTYISAKTEHPELICQIIDFFYADENQIAAEFGEEGVTFEYVEDAFGNKVPNYIGDYKGATVKLDEQFNMIRTSAVNRVVEAADDATLDAMISDEAMLYSSQAQFEKELRRMDKLVYPFPDLVYPADDNTRRAALESDLTNVIISYKASFILGELDVEENWEKFQSDLEAAGMQEYIKIQTNAYNTFMGK